MSVFIIPPIAFISLLTKPILLIWLGNEITAENTAQILQIMILGTMFICCSLPPVSILYSRKKLMPVVSGKSYMCNILIPILVFAINFYGTFGTPFMWCFYGLVLYFSHHLRIKWTARNKINFLHYKKLLLLLV